LLLIYESILQGLHKQARKKGVACLCRQRGSSKTQAENKKQSTPVADMITVIAFLLLVKIC